MQWRNPFLVALTIPVIMFASTSLADQSAKKPAQMPLSRQEHMAPAHQAVPAQIFRASNLAGTEVENARGEKLGEIEDVVIDAADGSITYVVLKAGGFLGVGEKYYAIPWRAFQAKVDDAGEMDGFVLDVDKERLQNATGFDRDHWPHRADPQWGETLHAENDQQNHWHRRQARRLGSQDAGVSATVQNVRGNTVELQVPQGLVNDLQTGDRVDVNVQKQKNTHPAKFHQMQEKRDREELNKNTRSIR
jgi:sporulation protein YlmC with PRC-barrel domain